jgi:hypothetical protein
MAVLAVWAAAVVMVAVTAPATVACSTTRRRMVACLATTKRRAMDVLGTVAVATIALHHAWVVPELVAPVRATDALVRIT